MKDKKYISLLKGISWRIVGTIDTMCVSFYHTRDALSSLKLGFTEVITKIILYYIHERIYFYFFKEKTYSRSLSLTKGISWRIVGTIDTILLAWYINSDPMLGLKIGTTEFFTKIVLYYFHERAWNRVNHKKNKDS